MSSRMSIAPQRNLTLTEELERLEQSITLTLQEIDHNFSRAHRIVTSSIIPIVEQYAKNSDQVWEGSKFWKQFFEASANISLSSYEEGEQDETFVTQSTEAHGQHTAGQHADDGDDVDETITTDEDHNPPTTTQVMDDSLADSLLSSPSVRSNRTPHGSGKSSRPLDDTQRSILSSHDGSSLQFDDPTTPGRRGHGVRDLAETPGRPSPFLHSAQPTTQRKQQNDVLLHRVLDKTYRVQATPHSARKTAGPSRVGAQRGEYKTQQMRPFALDSSPLSPEMAAPQLRAEIFGSPRRAAGGGAPLTPGVSVQQGKTKTPRRGAAAAGVGAPMSARKTLFSKEIAANSASRPSKDETQRWGLGDGGDDGQFDLDDTSDFDMNEGTSPPKTLQFHVPQPRLLQTPAKEASRRIVDDLIAGAALTHGHDDDQVTDTLSSLHIDETRYRGFDDSFDLNQAPQGYVAEEEDSPSVVRVARDAGVDDSF